jgi:hydroxymethylbilane synthase
LRPDLEVIDFRGNVETRLAKLERGLADATLLALAGLERLGLASHVTAVMPTSEMLPAVAQGAIGVAARADDQRALALLRPLNDAMSAQAIACERNFLAELDGSCKTPIAGLAEIAQDGALRFRGLILRPDGSEWHEIEMTGASADAASIGTAAGRDLVARAGPAFLASLG